MKLFNRILQMVCLTVILSTAVSAYLDPSVMTYTIQVVAGVIVAVGALMKMPKKKSKRMLSHSPKLPTKNKTYASNPWFCCWQCHGFQRVYLAQERDSSASFLYRRTILNRPQGVAFGRP